MIADDGPGRGRPRLAHQRAVEGGPERLQIVVVARRRGRSPTAAGSAAAGSTSDELVGQAGGFSTRPTTMRARPSRVTGSPTAACTPPRPPSVSAISPAPRGIAAAAQREHRRAVRAGRVLRPDVHRVEPTRHLGGAVTDLVGGAEPLPGGGEACGQSAGTGRAVEPHEVLGRCRTWHRWTRPGCRSRTMPKAAPATATVSRTSIRICLRHSRRYIRSAQRIDRPPGRQATTCQRPGPASAAPRARRHVMASTSVGEQRLRAGRGCRLVDHPAVADEHDTVGPGGELGVVGHHDAGQPALARRRAACASQFRRWPSRARRSARRPAAAAARPRPLGRSRPVAARHRTCRRDSARRDRARPSSSSTPIARGPGGPRPHHRRVPAATPRSPTADNPASRLRSWNTKPIERRRSLAWASCREASHVRAADLDLALGRLFEAAGDRQ